MSTHVLSVVIFLPAAGAAAILLARSERAARWIALLVTCGAFAASLPLYCGFDKTTAALQFVESARWIPSWNITYRVGLDGISLPFVFLSAVLSILCVGASWRAVRTRTREFYAALLVAETAMIGLFAAADLFLFYVFWELSIVPLFLLIGIWGGKSRVYAAVKFLLFTLAGSVLMLLALISLHQAGGGTLDLAALAGIRLSPSLQAWLFAGFVAAFAVKVPMFPLHTWLPDAHTEAPTAGSVLLAGILLKMGAYGFLRVCLPLFPDATLLFLKPMLALSVAAIVWGAYVTLAQTDLKRLIAYSSVSHMGFVTLGIFTLNRGGVEGAVLQMVNHGVITGALFLCVGMLYERTHTRELARYGGLFQATPAYCVFLALFCLAAAGFPGLNSFVGEFLILSGAFKTKLALGFAAAWGVVLGATYMVWLYYRLAMGEAGEIVISSCGAAVAPEGRSAAAHEGGALSDLDWREAAILAPLAALAFIIGLYPECILGYVRVSVESLLTQVRASAGVGL